MMRTLVAALTACLVCVALAGCDSKSSSGGGGRTVEKREVSSEPRAEPGGGAMPQRRTAEDSPDSPDQ